MASLAQIRYNILNLKNGGRESDDSLLSHRQTDFIINYCRALLIRRDYEKNHAINPDIEQDLGCVELELVDSADCCQVQTGCKVLRSVFQLPKALEMYDKNMITYVGTVDGLQAFDIIPSARVRWVNFNKYTVGKRRAFIMDRYLYIVNDSILKYVNVTGVFENPIEASKFNHCDGTPCFDENSEYPVAMWMIQIITDMIIKGEVKDTYMFPTDNKNDASGVK